MEVEKRGTKGGFFHLFDWNSKSKSRKKLFSSKSELDEGTRQTNNRIDKLIEVDEDIEVGMTYRAGYDSNQASSVSSDEGYGTRAPGVVARLMGLDTLPSTSVSEPHSLHSSAIRETHYSKTSPEFMNDLQIIEYSCKSKEFEVFSVKPRSQKFPNRSIQRFQTEVLPPKSAKSIPITHHKLLSPIKSPGFVSKKSAAYIMEAAAKFIESGPQAAIKGKNPSFGSSSIPLRIQDLKQKMEAAQKVPRPEKHKMPGVVRNMKLQSHNKRWDGSKDTPMHKACAESGKIGSGSSKNNDKSVSLALQAKVNVQRREEMTSCSNRRREGLTSSSSGNFMIQKGHNEVNSNRISKSQPGLPNSAQRSSITKKIPGVLRQNNQKQNCVSSKDRFSARTSGSCQQVKQFISVNGSSGPCKTINTVVVSSSSGSGKMSSVRTDIGKEISSSKTKFSQKKRPIIKDDHFEKSVYYVSNNQDVNSAKSHVAVDGSMHQEVDSRKKNMDVVSFTFTSPIKRSVQMPPSYRENDHPDLKNSRLSPPGPNIISRDALSVLLDQKLRELTCKIENCNLVEAGTAASTASGLHETVSTMGVVRTMPEELQRRFQLSQHVNNSDSLLDIDAFSADGLVLEAEQKQQGFGMEEHCSSSDSSKAEKDLVSQHQIPISDLESSSSSGSCKSSDSRTTNNDNGTNHFSSTQLQEAIGFLFTRNPSPTEVDVELSDSASSTWDVGGSYSISLSSVIDNETSINWELEYVRNIVYNAQLCKDIATGEAHSMLKPCIFDQLEDQKDGFEQSEAEFSRLERKVLFDCVTECLDLRCQRSSGGGCKAWAKWVTLFQRKGWLAEELYKEILGWRSMAEQMVDGLVDKDMSSGYGKWVDFEFEAFEEGVQIEKDILTCLVDDLVDDLFLS